MLSDEPLLGTGMQMSKVFHLAASLCTPERALGSIEMSSLSHHYTSLLGSPAFGVGCASHLLAPSISTSRLLAGPSQQLLLYSADIQLGWPRLRPLRCQFACVW